MKVLGKDEVAEYITFLKQYYPITDLKLCIAEVNEKEWRILYTNIRKGCVIIENMLNGNLIESEVTEKFESHGTHETGYEDGVGYFIPTNNLLTVINLWKDNEASRSFRKSIDGTEFFVMLRTQVLKDSVQYLDALFHEILHTIEIKTQTRIFRGSTMQQEIKDTEEIVLPYVREFIRKRKHC